jgi:hypothetical protein
MANADDNDKHKRKRQRVARVALTRCSQLKDKKSFGCSGPRFRGDRRARFYRAFRFVVVAPTPRRPLLRCPYSTADVAESHRHRSLPLGLFYRFGPRFEADPGAPYL